MIYEDCRESLIEDFPGHYIESNLANYGRYNDGTEFPKGIDKLIDFEGLICYLFKTVCI